VKSLFFALSLGLVLNPFIAQAQNGSTSDLRQMTEEQAFAYRQTSLQYEDAYGDRALQLRVNRAKKSIFGALTGHKGNSLIAYQYDEEGENPTNRNKQMAQSKDQALALVDDMEFAGLSPSQVQKKKNELKASIRNQYRQLEGRENPYKIKGFVKMFQQVIAEEMKNGIQPRQGRVHEWSESTKKEFGGHLAMHFPKLLVGLGVGMSSRLMVSGQESELRQYLLNQPESSVSFAEFFRKSYQLHQGDVYLSLLCMENVLSANWKAPHRNEIGFFKSLSPLQSAMNGGGDNFGSYYHFIGTLLYGYAYGATASNLIGIIEAMGSAVLNGFQPEPQESFANIMGGKIGSRWRKVLRQKRYENFQMDSRFLEETSYLRRGEDFRDRLLIGQDPDLMVRITNRSTVAFAFSVSHRSQDLQKCTLELYGYSSRKKGADIYQVYENVSLRPGHGFRPEEWVSGGQEFSHLRVFISDCQNNPETFAADYR